MLLEPGQKRDLENELRRGIGRTNLEMGSFPDLFCCFGDVPAAGKSRETQRRPICFLLAATGVNHVSASLLPSQPHSPSHFPDLAPPQKTKGGAATILVRSSAPLVDNGAAPKLPFSSPTHATALARLRSTGNPDHLKASGTACGVACLCMVQILGGPKMLGLARTRKSR